MEGGDSALADSSKHSPFLTSVALVLPAFNLSQLLFIQSLFPEGIPKSHGQYEYTLRLDHLIVLSALKNLRIV